MLDRAIEWAAEQPRYISGGYDENGDVIPEENLEPYEAVATFEEMVASNPNAVAILHAQGRADLVQTVRPVDTPNAADDVPFGDEPRRYYNYQCHNCDRIVNREQPPTLCTMCGCDDFQPVN